MFLLSEMCTLQAYNEEILGNCNAFECSHQDLNDFFKNDAIDYSYELIGKSYCFTLDSDPKVIVCAFTLSNDSIKLKNIPSARRSRIKKYIPHAKHFNSYPAVLIGRLGVNKDFSRKGIGCQLMDFIKAWFIDSRNKTGCRFIVVDAYNESAPLEYYKKNGFDSLFTSDKQEREYYGIGENEQLKTKFLFFDLITLSQPSKNKSTDAPLVIEKS